MTLPYLTVRKDSYVEHDSLAAALEAKQDHDTIYERLGHSTGGNIDREDRLAEAARALIRNWVGPGPTRAQWIELTAALDEHDQALREMRAAWEANERSATK